MRRSGQPPHSGFATFAAVAILVFASAVTARAAHRDTTGPRHLSLHAWPASPAPARDHRAPVPTRRHPQLLTRRAKCARRAWLRPPGGLASQDISSAQPSFELGPVRGARSRCGLDPELASHSERGPPVRPSRFDRVPPEFLLSHLVISPRSSGSGITAFNHRRGASGAAANHRSTEGGSLTDTFQVFGAV